MADLLNNNPTENAQNRRIREAICVDTARVYDSCADKDCLADLRVYLTEGAQAIIDNATAIRCRGCEVINVYTDVEPVPFNRGYYSVDITFFFAVNVDAFSAPTAQPTAVTGLCVFAKKAILYGSEGSVKVFSSEYADGAEEQLPPVSTNPVAKVQVAQPLCLDARLCRSCDCCNNINDARNGIPQSICRYFGGTFRNADTERAVRATIGLFSIVQLERSVQMLIPAYDFCMPGKECSNDTETPCDSFRKIRFPVNEFFPPAESDAQENQSDGFDPPCCCGR